MTTKREEDRKADERREYDLDALAKCDSVVLRRLAEEVRNGDESPTGYNRVYSRHNRGA